MSERADDAAMQHAETERMLPERLGQFAITGLLGRGGSGVVYAARLEEREVALKVLRHDQVPTDKERNRFLAEARHMARIVHPGVVSVVAVGELEDGRPYLAMERLHGANLAERVAASAIPRAQALELFQQLASAVATMHASGLIHRDLKPENVMLVDEGTRAVLLDFGIARATDAPPSTTTQAGMQRGTPAVMAPERFFGARATLRTDVYELAVVLYVMLTRSLPWRDPLDAKARLNPLRPRALGVELPDALEAALMRALSATTDERPASIAEFAGDVRRACSGIAAGDGAEAGAGDEPAARLADLATAPTVAATTERTSDRRAARTLALVALLLAGIAGIGALALSMRDSTPESDSPEVAAPAAGASASEVSPEAPPVHVSAIPAVTPDAGSGEIESKPAAAKRLSRPLDAGREQARREERPPEPKASGGTKRREHAPREKRDGAEPAAASATSIPWCRKIAALYCTPEFEATEGSMAGTLCKNFNAQVSNWAKLPPESIAKTDESCKGMYEQLAKAAAERIRFSKSLQRTDNEPPE